MSNVVRLPRPRSPRPGPEGLGFFVRARHTNITDFDGSKGRRRAARIVEAAASNGGPSWRVSISQLDLLLKPKTAGELFAASPKVRALCGCRDTHCCPHGTRDMVDHPARHAIYQRAREIEQLTTVPRTLRAVQYLNQTVRRVSDYVAGVAVLPNANADLAKSLQDKQREKSRFRQLMAHRIESAGSASVAMAPSNRRARKGGKWCEGGNDHVWAEVEAMTSAVARKLESLRDKGAMKNIEVANLLGTRPETVSRWNQGRAYPHASTEKTLLELEYIIDQLADFYEPGEARQWIFAPQKLLAGESPANLIRTGRIDEVMRLVGQLRDAVHF